MDLEKRTEVSGPFADARDMFAVHTMFRREFGLMPALVRNVDDGDHKRMPLVAGHVELVTALLHDHHSAEDQYIWPRLIERGNAEIDSIVERMEAQHEAVATSLHHVSEDLQSWRASASKTKGNSLATSIERVITALNEHLTDEELHVVPLIEKYVTDAEYAQGVKSAVSHVAPGRFEIAFGMVMYETAPDVVDAIVARLPSDMRPFIKVVASKAYSGYAKDLYGTSTPPRSTVSS